MTVARRLAAACLAALFALCLSALGGDFASAAAIHEPTGSFGVLGTGAGGFINPQSIAVDESSGDVFVWDAGTQSIYKYTSSGQPAEFSALKSNAIANVSGVAGETQIAVDSSSGPAKGDIYIANTSTVAIYASDGSYLGELSGAGNPGGENCGVAVDGSGNVYVGLWEEHVNKYTPTANPVTNSNYVSTLYTHDGMCYVAADSSKDLYTVPWSGGSVKRYDIATEFNTLGTEAIGTVVDPNGQSLAADRVKDDIYVDETSQVAQYDSSGKKLGVIGGVSGSYGVGVNGASGDVYVADGSTGRVKIFGPSITIADVASAEATEVELTTATLNGSVNPLGLQVTSCQFEYGTTTAYGQSAPCSPEPGSGSSEVPVRAALSGLTEGTLYHFRLKATDANGTNVSEDRTFETHGPPGVVNETAGEIGLYAARMSGEVNPHAFDTTYRFEYGTTTAYGTSVPVPDGDLGSGTSFVPVNASLSGLEQGTTYHYRIVATNSHGEARGEDHTFTTEPAVFIERESSLEDEVSTAKLQAVVNPRGLDTTYHFEYGTSTAYGTSIPVPDGTISGALGEQGVTVGVQITGLQPGTDYHFRVVAANRNGTDAGPDRSFTTFQLPPFAGKDTCPNASLRTGVSANLPDCRAYEMVTPVDKNGGDVNGSRYKEFTSSESGDRLQYPSRTGIGDTQGSGLGGYGQYIATRTDTGWVSRGVLPTPALRTQLQFAIGTKAVAFSTALDRAVLSAYDLPQVKGIPDRQDLYLEETLPIDVLEPLTRQEGTEEPVERTAMPYEISGASNDLSVVTFQTTANLLPQAKGSAPKLYVVDHKKLLLGGILSNGSVPAGGSQQPRNQTSGSETYEGAVSNDGSRYLFVSPGDGSSPQQLYLRKGETETVWVSRSESSNPVSEPHGVYFQAATPDDRHIVFTSADSLLDTDPGGSGTGLYMYTDSPHPESESNLTFIARVGGLSGGRWTGEVVKGMSEDGSHVYFMSGEAMYLWDSGVIHRVAPADGLSEMNANEGGPIEARVSTDGREIAFVNNRQLTAQEVGNLPLVNSTENAEMYLYDEGTETLRCVSCPSSGATATLGIEKTVHVTAPTNPGFSVPEPPRFLSSDGRFVFFNTAEGLLPQDTNKATDAYEYDTQTGKLKLLSPGSGETGTWFVDANPDGRNVFLATRQQLSGWDVDKLVDVYDARVDGGFPEPPPPGIVCQGEACQGTPSAAPSFQTASGFSGLGNRAGKTAVKSRSRSLTRAQKQKLALKACHRKRRRSKRLACERGVRRRFRAKTAAARSAGHTGSKTPRLSTGR